MFYGTNFKTFEAMVGWDWDTRNRTLFADRGMRQSLSLSSTIPGSDDAVLDRQLPVREVRAAVASTSRCPSSRASTTARHSGSTTAIPPYRQFFGGGPDNVRGFRESRLGPKDQFGNPYGGNFRITSQNELILPMPAKCAQTARVSAFFDMGNVFETSNKLTFYGPNGMTPVDYKFHGFSEPAGARWVSPCSGWHPWVCSGSASASP